MNNQEETQDTLVCLRCGYTWTPRKTAELPRCCPYCKSPKWNVPKKEQ